MNFRKNKIFVLLVAVALLLLFVGAVSASDNTNYDTKKVIKEKQLTKPIPCKVKVKSRTAYEGQDKKIVAYIRDNKNRLLKNVDIHVTEVHNGYISHYSSNTDNKGRYIDSTTSFKLGKTKVRISSADNRYTFSGSFYVNIKPIIKTVILKCPRDIYYTKKGISAYYTLGGQDNPGVYARVEGRSSVDGYIHKKILVAAFYFKHNKNGKFIVRAAKGHTNRYVSNAYYHLIKGYTPFYAKVWYTQI